MQPAATYSHVISVLLPLVIMTTAHSYIMSNESVPSQLCTMKMPIRIAMPPATAMPRYVPAAYSASLVRLCATHTNDVKDMISKKKNSVNKSAA